MHDNGDVYFGDKPFKTMGGRWVGGRTDALNWNGWFTWRNHDGRINAPMDQFPSDAVLGPKVAKAYAAWIEADSAYELAKDELEASKHPSAMERAEQADARRVVEIATAGGDHVKAADESPNVDKLKRNRKIYAGNLAKAEAPRREALKALIAVLNDESLQQAAVERAVKAKREADSDVAKLEAALNAAKAKAASAGHDLMHAAEWSNVRAADVLAEHD